jgi:WD40 repeat protein
MPGRISGLRFHKDGAKFVAGSSLDGKGEVWIYDTEKGAPVKCAKVTGPVYAVAWNGDGVASAGFDGTVWLHDSVGKLVKSFPAAPMK